MGDAMSRESKPTPGPWRLEPSPQGSWNGGRIIGANGELVARLTGAADKPLSQKEADGRLIVAAANDKGGMADALMQIAVACEEIALQENVSPADYHAYRALAEKARAALPKVET